MPVRKLPFSKQLSYAAGMIGWSILTNLIIVMLPFFYLPPSNAGLKPLIPQLIVFGVLNIMSVIVASGRLVDAIGDPLIASLSDKSSNPNGRRIPFMKWAIIPAMFFFSLAFTPIVNGESMKNALWLSIVLIGFFISTSVYFIPYYALLPELTETSSEKVKLSSFQQVGFVIGMIISGSVNNMVDIVQGIFHLDHLTAIQYTIWSLCIFAGACMFIPVFSINEKLYTDNKPAMVPLIPSIRKTFSNTNFKYYLVSDFSFYLALSIISSGLLYFVTVLLNLPASEGGYLMGTMVLVSLCCYPLINYFSNLVGKKKIVLFSLFMLGVLFIAIYFLGRLPLGPRTQIYLLMIFAGFPLASLGILPNAILSDIIQQDAAETGENREGMYFAVKYFFVKIGQTTGIALFAFLTIYGKDPGHDQGLRMNGLFGFALCMLAFIFFSRFKEKT